MRVRSGFEHKKARVEMLPLIDVVFILLVFFIYAMLAMVVHRGMEVRLPTASTAQREQQDSIQVSITEDGQLWVNRVPVGLAGLANAVQEVLAGGSTNRIVLLQCDERADSGVVLRSLDALRAAGIHQVTFATREGS